LKKISKKVLLIFRALVSRKFDFKTGQNRLKSRILLLKMAPQDPRKNPLMQKVGDFPGNLIAKPNSGEFSRPDTKKPAQSDRFFDRINTQ
jgi:hypothetical protein